jgi:Uma2 family endonuclease
MNQMTAIPPAEGQQPLRFSATDYLRMIDANIFGDSHVELFDGVLIEMAASNTKHGRLLMHLARLLGNAYDRSGFEIYGDIITLFDDSNIRAPDIAVVDKDIGDRKQLVPADILLAVEIASSSLALDLGRKRIDYASAGIRHYWVVDVEGRRVHCYADPLGADYAAILVVPFGEAVPVPGADGPITVG